MALSPYALTTLASFQAYAQLQGCGVTSTAQIEALINAASALIERVSGRQFVARDYVQWYSGDWQQELALKVRPVAHVARVAYGNQVAFTITYSGSAVRAEVFTAEDGITLRTTTSAGTVASTAITSALFPTFSTMVTKIGTVAGFTAVLGGADGPSDELMPTIYGSFTSNGGSIALYYPGFDTPIRNINRDSGIIGFPGSGWTPWGGWGVWNGGMSGSQNGNCGAYSAAWGAYMPQGFQGIMIKYRAGYETIPADIEQLTNEIAAFMFYQAGGNTALQSESIGAYSYSRMNWADVQDAFRTRIMAFADVAMGVGSW